MTDSQPAKQALESFRTLPKPPHILFDGLQFRICGSSATALPRLRIFASSEACLGDSMTLRRAFDSSARFDPVGTTLPLVHFASLPLDVATLALPFAATLP